MKLTNLLRLQLIFFGIFIICTFSFQGCESDKDDKCDIEETCDSCNVSCDTCHAIVYKPNIYLYPTMSVQLDVILSFPLGGEIITSVPEYGNKWNVNIDTNGFIDNQYNFLFYESLQPDIWQRNNGWIVDKDNLETFFIKNMQEYGFYGHEIEDYVDYWIPRLSDYKYYKIFPQINNVIDKVIRLDFSIKPDNILRLYYVINGTDNKTDKILEPQISSGFVRKGFYVTEWGVILK